MTDVLVVTGGHRVELDALLGMVDAVCEERGWRWAHSTQPAAQRWLRRDCPWDAVLLHDIAGLHLRRGESPVAIGPSAETAAALLDLLDAGQGLVVTHHALASWPGWDSWASAIGGRFLYAPGPLRGTAMPSSGTRFARYHARVVTRDHPVCAGLPSDGLVLDDELYLCPVFESEVVPLVRADVDLDPARYIRTYEHVVHGEAAAPDCTGHPPGSDLVAWATSAGASPIVYVQPGDSGRTFAVPGYRRLIANALAWVSSDEAHAWARSRGAP